ncbi:MAG: hypothetical protein MJ200_05335 [Mycoplasmoidaceae bacterium]|nr:hypothetical protein [Mycoplasmoidaceae bacterium]
MACFYRFETVDIPLLLKPTGVLYDYSHIVVSIVQNGITKVNKHENDLEIDTENDTIIISLSQEETSKFVGGVRDPREALIQVNIYYNDHERDVSTVGTINVFDNLYDKVIDNE